MNIQNEWVIKMKFRKKPVVIEAEQFDGTKKNAQYLAKKYEDRIFMYDDGLKMDKSIVLHVHTRE